MKIFYYLTLLLTGLGSLLWADVNDDLLSAAQSGDVAAVTEAISNGANVNHKTLLDESALIYAIDECQTDVVRLLIEQNANIEVITKLRQTPLIKAAAEDCAEIVELLLKEGAVVNRSDPKNEYNALFKAVEYDRLKITELLLQNGADINYANKFAITPLMLAAQHGNKVMVDLLINNGANVQAKSIIGKSALLLALEFDHPEIANALLIAGADVNQVDKYNNSPLTYAASLGYGDIVGTLVENGADVNQKTGDEKSAALLAQEHEHTDIVTYLLENGADSTGIVFPDSTTEEFVQLVDTTAYDEPPAPIGGLQAVQKRLRYPKDAKEQGLVGTVVINVLIDKNGRVQETEIMESFENEDCNKAAERAVRNTRWQAAKVGRKSVEGWVTIPVEFKLDP